MPQDLVIMPFEGTMYPHEDEHVVEEARAMFCQPCQAPTVEDCTCEGPNDEYQGETDIPDEPDFADYNGEMADYAQNVWERAYWGD